MAATSGIPFVAGSSNQNGLVYGPNGQPYMVNGQQVYDPSGITGLWTTTNPNPAPPPTTTYLPGTSAPYSPLPPPVISTPYATTGATAAGGGYTPPEVQALNAIRQIDPRYLQLANKTQSGYLGAEKTALQQLQLAQSGQLPPGVQREIQQQVAGQEAGTGNSAGVAQAVQQGMTTGTAGYQYLQNQLNYNNSVLQQANSYLGSGTSPYAMGTNYVNNALNQQNAAFSGNQVSYNPYGSAPAYSYINPGAGGEFAQGTTGFLNAGVGATPGSPDTSGQYIAAGVGATGAIIGGLAASGALAAF
jgi:hypothetical protein